MAPFVMTNLVQIYILRILSKPQSILMARIGPGEGFPKMIIKTALFFYIILFLGMLTPRKCMFEGLKNGAGATLSVITGTRSFYFKFWQLQYIH